MKPPYIEPHHLEILQDILKNHPGCFIFGSRAKGTHKKFSDLDLCFIRNEPMHITERAELETKLEESNLPYTVDIVDYSAVSHDFQQIIDRDKCAFPYGDVPNVT